ncbi:hypothetical protein KUTeg_021621 [Tegillarca granosa]|uniref:ShKT domain-containing protein n=1 Tax=Tegillarca granosa TaxID=220873 RepID=A0ABQ9E975_TEGGR|nr:hypothetical protein KUTeg_021621 [Tegillarca granosa]
MQDQIVQIIQRIPVSHIQNGHVRIVKNIVIYVRQGQQQLQLQATHQHVLTNIKTVQAMGRALVKIMQNGQRTIVKNTAISVQHNYGLVQWKFQKPASYGTKKFGFSNVVQKKAAGTDSACADKHQDCAGYGKSACQDYPKWASENCQKYCNLCQTQRTALQSPFIPSNPLNSMNCLLN